MTKVRKISTRNLQFRKIHGPPGSIEIASAIGVADSQSMSGDVIVFNDTSLDYTMPYDDLIYVLEGELVLKTSAGDIVGGPGDVLWVPTGETLTFTATGRTVVFCATHPVNWQDLTYLGRD